MEEVPMSNSGYQNRDIPINLEVNTEKYCKWMVCRIHGVNNCFLEIYCFLSIFAFATLIRRLVEKGLPYFVNHCYASTLRRYSPSLIFC